MLQVETAPASQAGANTTSLSVVMAADILRANIETPPRLQELARLVGLSHPRLNRAFRQYFGTTVFGYLRFLRLEEARGLLERSDSNVTETAFSVGYQSLPSFSRAFRAQFGVCPRQYRDSHRRGPPVAPTTTAAR